MARHGTKGKRKRIVDLIKMILSDALNEVKMGAFGMVADFSKQFRDLMSEDGAAYQPFPWQTRLFNRLCRGEIPAALDIPTGLGKTKVIALWLLALANGADLPRRLVYVVDRRAVVDQASREAEALAERISRLRSPLFEKGVGLSTLRGQHVDRSDWQRAPERPTIIVGTVDMIGSRLLFGGYGLSRKSRPMHAGLLGTDTLLVLDEAHLVPPFAALVAEIANGAGAGEVALPLPSGRQGLRAMQLSATRRGEGAAFGLDQDDMADEVVRQRVHARKALVTVAVPPDATEAAGSAKPRRELVAALVNEARRMADTARPSRIVVFTDRRTDAEAVEAALADLGQVELLVGARRVRERGEAARALENCGFVAGSGTPEKTVFLVATAAGEVGVDLDADHAVMDLVPWERMVQRLGRVNRRGRGAAQVVVCDGGADLASDASTPLSPVRDLLRLLPVSGAGAATDPALPAVQAGPAALAELARNLPDLVRDASTRTPLRPALTRAEIEAWALTGLESHTGRPDIAPWLRGWIEEEVQTRVVWRRHLPVRHEEPGSAAEVAAFFEAAPVHLSEVLETETYRAGDWLTRRAKALLSAKGEATLTAGATEGTEQAGHKTRPLAPEDIVAIALGPDGTPRRSATLREIGGGKASRGEASFGDALPGATLILDARLGGLSPSGLLDDAADGPAVAADAPDPDEGEGAWGVDVRFSVRMVQATEDGTADAATEGETFRFVTRSSEAGDDLEWLSVRSVAEQGQTRARVPVTLARHTANVSSHAGRIATGLGLTEAERGLLAHAARLHDAGKAAPVWQRAAGADKLNRERERHEVWGKTPSMVPGLLAGYSHEFGSLLTALADPALAALAADDRDLVLHLIASHHGRARPIISAAGGGLDRPPSSLAPEAREVALRMARLQARWGPWGLAWWEAVFRAADQSASEEESQAGGRHG